MDGFADVRSPSGRAECTAVAMRSANVLSRTRDIAASGAAFFEHARAGTDHPRQMLPRSSMK
jgi:hypothetical protein